MINHTCPVCHHNIVKDSGVSVGRLQAHKGECADTVRQAQAHNKALAAPYAPDAFEEYEMRVQSRKKRPARRLAA